MASAARDGTRASVSLKPISTPPHLSARRVLVTGASGFIGTRLVARLSERGESVIAIDLEEPRFRLEGVTYRQLDVREPISAEIGAGVSRIYNLAAIHRTPGHPTHSYYETNVLGAANTVSLAETCGIDTIAFTSSISVYGASEEVMTEASPLRPNSHYGLSKRIAEKLHQSWQERHARRRLVIVRPGVVFGPGERGNFTHLARALSQRTFFYPGRKSTIKSGGYVDELLEALDFALAQTDPLILFNFAYPYENTTEDIVHAFARVSGQNRAPLTFPLAPLYLAAALFEIANHLGLSNPVHRERVLKLVQSTRIEPTWLLSRGYYFRTDLEQALRCWWNETDGLFV